ncbi:hypothetical protein RI845_16045 [Thalassotalea nanhaiensis]|uniref:ATP-binding protein n=1 Tax=Thalassotalea nanhaiensis TaxID=3065648 RepID=A0ABY9TIG8_9GAMM|nr:hypothetical protein RI845_16045 [Colwelliaceae bacterium SQ345]
MRYIDRTLAQGGNELHQSQIQILDEPILILAEPGAGKTALLKSLANLTSEQCLSARTFQHMQHIASDFLFIDGLDEVAKQGASSVEAIIVKSLELSPKSLVISCRAGEWDDSYNTLFEDFGRKLKTYHLKPFNKDEQQELFIQKFPKESFTDFYTKLSEFELDSLLGNPLFIYVFGLAYSSDNNLKVGKYELFNKATEVLLKENTSSKHSHQERPTVDTLSVRAGEVCSTILLSGASGITSRESKSSEQYPYLFSITQENSCAKWLLDCQLILPIVDIELFEPIHRVITEFIAAKYLVSKLEDPNDELSLGRLSSLIAPNSYVRDDLRGLLGWIITLSNSTNQIEFGNLDPVSVFAYGDASKLKSDAKLALLNHLLDASEKDPFFLREDRWRQFSIKEFVCHETEQEILKYLSAPDINLDLLSLILDILVNTSSIESFILPLTNIIKSNKYQLHFRKTALRILVKKDWRKYIDLFDWFIKSEADIDKLELACCFVECTDSKFVEHEKIALLCNKLAPIHKRKKEKGVFRSNWYITIFMRSLNSDVVENVLNALTCNIACSCKAKHDFECHCLDGISKVIGRLLDQYFKNDLTPTDIDENKLLEWLVPLNFHSTVREDDSPSVMWLHQHHEVRRSIQRKLFSQCINIEEVNELSFKFYRTYGFHSGLRFEKGDVEHLIRFAFENDNLPLWNSFLRRHNTYSDAKEDDLRTIMRKHANQKSKFMAFWAATQHAYKVDRKINREPKYRFERRRAATDNKIRQANEIEFSKHKSKVLAGKHFGFLRAFAHSLMFGDRYEQNLGHLISKETQEKALESSLDFIKGDVSDLTKLARTSSRTSVDLVLMACLICIFRKHGTLAHIDKRFLEIARVEANVRYDGISEEENSLFLAEVDRCLFTSRYEAKQFLYGYVEPQFSFRDDTNSCSCYILEQKPFNSLVVELSNEWLSKYPVLPIQAESVLFEHLTKNSAETEIRQITSQRCLMYKNLVGPLSKERQKVYIQWCIRKFLYCDEYEFEWLLLKSNKENLFKLESTIDGRWSMGRREIQSVKSNKTYIILDSFVNYLGSWEEKEEESGERLPNDVASEFFCHLINSLPIEKESILLLEKLMEDNRFNSFTKLCRHNYASKLKSLSLLEFSPPHPNKVFEFLAKYKIVGVFDLRKLVLEHLISIQLEYRAGSTTPINKFYEQGQRVGENQARDRLVEDLKPRLKLFSVDIEFNTANSERCDFVVKSSNDVEHFMLAVEAKGQWHTELFNAATEQLYGKYLQHPESQGQGIYLVFWFGTDEKVAGCKNKYTSPDELKREIETRIDSTLQPLIDVFVLDLSKK